MRFGIAFPLLFVESMLVRAARGRREHRSNRYRRKQYRQKSARHPIFTPPPRDEKFFCSLFPPIYLNFYKVGFLFFSAAERNTFDEEFLTEQIHDNKRKHTHKRGRTGEIEIVPARFFKVFYKLLHSYLNCP